MINPANFMQELNNYVNNYHGDAQQEVQDLVRTGKIDQGALNMYQGVARAIVNGNPSQAIAMLFGQR